jgi:hypothetical protein
MVEAKLDGYRSEPSLAFNRIGAVRNARTWNQDVETERSAASCSGARQATPFRNYRGLPSRSTVKLG